MKAAGLPLLALALIGPLAAQDTPVAARPKTSARLTQAIRASLPAFIPAQPVALNQPKDLESDADVLRLPTFTVKERRPPTHNPDLWLTEKSVQLKALAAYKQSMTDFKWALNSWYIPLVGTSPSARARSAYANTMKMAELQRVHTLLKFISALDPEGGAQLERERIRMDQVDDWQNRWR